MTASCKRSSLDAVISAGRNLAAHLFVATIKRILFPFDFSSNGMLTTPFVRALAQRLGATIVVYSVMPPAFDAAPATLAPFRDQDPAEWTRLLQSSLDAALVDQLAGLTVERIADAGNPGLRMVSFAQRHDVDLIMMPTHGFGLVRSLLIGSVTSLVLRDAGCPVWTIAHAPDAPAAAGVPRTVLCALDGTPKTTALIKWAAGFTSDCGATLTLLHVVSPITDGPFLEKERKRQDRFRRLEHDRIETIRQKAGVDAPLRVAVGSIVSTVAEEARRAETDLVIIGRGSVAEPFGRLRTHAFGIIQQAPCPVLCV